jgi:outer membrane lipoprotein-sorting protein
MIAARLSRALAIATVLVLVATEGNLAAPTAAVAPARILQMALEAPHLVDYEGTKVMTALRGGRMETITVAESHKRPDAIRLNTSRRRIWTAA